MSIRKEGIVSWKVSIELKSKEVVENRVNE